MSLTCVKSGISSQLNLPAALDNWNSLAGLELSGSYNTR